MEKKNIRVMVYDEIISISVDYGEWVDCPISNPILAVLTAICYPDSHELQIQDHRKNRQPYQKKLSNEYPDD